MKRFKLGEDEYQKLAEVTRLPLIEVRKLDAMGLLRNSTAVKLVLQYEYDRARKHKLGTIEQIICLIARKYHITPKAVKLYLYTKPPCIYYCHECRNEITKAEYKRFKGLCFNCSMNKIQL